MFFMSEERKRTDACYAIRNHDSSQGMAIRERMIANAFDAVRNRDVHQETAIIERMITNACDTVWNGKGAICFPACILN